MVFVNDRWVKTRFAKETLGINALKIVTSSTFWEYVDYSCSLLKPLVKVVRLVDIERKPTMPCFYDAMRIERDQLEENFSEDNDTWDIPSHLTDNDPKYIEIKGGLHTAMQRLITNEYEGDQATSELRLYSDAYGLLGTPTFKRRRDKDKPRKFAGSMIGGLHMEESIDVPHLQKFTIRVLSLTSSASTCERNWSTFQNLYSKKRNRIKQQKLNASVFIQYNKKLQRHYKEIAEYNDNEKARNPIFLDDRDENDEWLDPQNLDDLVVQGDSVNLENLQDILGEESGPVGTRGACSSRSKSTYPTDSEYDGYDTDELMLGTEYGLLGGANGVTEDDDIYNVAHDLIKIVVDFTVI
ncbi:uncharacterized protein LOC113272247 [Papaver somniferum]|uniref:uncharacterized protein LOC113272247 n=1 Tax=Papaver somniferum TaxID=3469 RepID=UPI000E6F7D7F|nr:uncharacterized protein LOC113272247 [Papaver somniferum]